MTEAPPTVEQLLAANAGLAWMVAHKLHRSFPSADLEDLHAEVQLGFVRAAVRFDHTRGLTFGTYAVRAGYNAGITYLRREAARGMVVRWTGPIRRVLVGSLDGAPPDMDDPDAPTDGALVPDRREPPPDPDLARVWEVVRGRLIAEQADSVEWVHRHDGTLVGLADARGRNREYVRRDYHEGMRTLRSDPAAIRVLEDLL